MLVLCSRLSFDVTKSYNYVTSITVALYRTKHSLSLYGRKKFTPKNLLSIILLLDLA
jgi:hypothetical protein